jgi:hypothetical protein
VVVALPRSLVEVDADVDTAEVVVTTITVAVVTPTKEEDVAATRSPG